ncbi:DUF58 domain-containing protein [Frankia sp. R82]|uniref:DUF58 domain-containing protein n=1 Tax=Frankia sp. R82 TaxID=2950553 RepID=UPI0020444851|nr:DUF58 domain-containing protein [Frankia sp. R82]MCM3885610.1 DUF58 domain-containing protein [Frankia sp. R82]
MDAVAPRARARARPARSRLRPTPLGWGLLATATLLLTGARLVHYPEVGVLGGTAAAAVALSLAVAVRHPRASAELSVSPHRVARGEPATLEITLHNHSRWTAPTFVVRLALSVTTPRSEQGAAAASSQPSAGDAGPSSGDARPSRAAPPPELLLVPITRLAGAGTRTVDVALPTDERGVIAIGPVEITRSDPFGLLTRSQRLPATATLHVRPPVRLLAPLASAPSREPDGQTGHGTAGGLEIHTLRPYAVGEDLRLVHWPSSARAGELMVRTHMDPTEPAATVVLDVRPDAYPPGPAGRAAFESAVDVAAAAVMTCAREAFGVRLVTTAGLRALGRRRRRDADMLLDELAAVELTGDATLDVLGTLRRGGLGTLVLVTGGFDRSAAAALAPVGHAYGRVVLVRVGPRSEATARAVLRRDSTDRARLRPASPVRAWGRSSIAGVVGPRGGTAHLARAGGGGTGTVGRLTVIDVRDAAALADSWPAAWPRGRGSLGAGRR